ncbi:putative POL2-DNA polymerase epsilon, calytic subunit A [Gonapodya prolifera JEL478]|uniref:DNA polymerase epsilon catalytic subunit n=1 Tax=Gonapodya prolifera (strain JEL478) TaxID=1344416 RepID=A0A139A7K7_GONPJ|nr:putative POL2-DNA polymerase epsilon, calytic subunit A [Gonapodya prolifera JEL478]|eukprot:KXS12658.1 putative POL2-DNA polymerase epsilon, calytic subunit A [Gonapodya prolifera JEL478]
MFGIPPGRGAKGKARGDRWENAENIAPRSVGRGSSGHRGQLRNVPTSRFGSRPTGPASRDDLEDFGADLDADTAFDGFKELKDASSTVTGFTSPNDELQDLLFVDEIDEKMGFWRYEEGPERIGWLVNMRPTLVRNSDWPGGKSAVDLYFLEDDGGRFKVTLQYEPYFLVCPKEGCAAEVEEHLRRLFDRQVHQIQRIEKEDLDLPNHLIGAKRTVVKLAFRNVRDLLSVRKVLLQTVQANREGKQAAEVYENNWNIVGYEDELQQSKGLKDPLDLIDDIREYDVPYYIRVAIDNGFRVGHWFAVTADATSHSVTLSRRSDLLHRAEPVVLAFDIETTKQPLKFPDQQLDAIMMISYMVDGQGYLITNREVVSEDVEDFEYTPKPEYEGPFTVFNESDEASVLRRFFAHILSARPSIIATYNGDFFDFPFVEARARACGMDMYKEIGWKKDSSPGGGDIYQSSYGIHMDCFAWVKRDSYLPQGSQGLKAVTSAKLGYNPLELDPEDMTRFAIERPQTLAQYSVSDAVATYYLFMKYVNPFVFSLCTVIPGCADDVLRKGSGTMCEMLLMVQAFENNILMPNKYVEKRGKTFEGHLVFSETYVGGHVEALEAGVFRSDLPTKFRIVPEAVQGLLDQLDGALKHTIEVEGKSKVQDVENYDEVRSAIASRLLDLRDRPLRSERPLIYHLDVAAMYPNIMLTNRLQPDSMVDERTCATCDFNCPESDCQREMTWSRRAEFFPAKRNEVNMLRSVLENEKFKASGRFPSDPSRNWNELSHSEQTKALEKRVGDYSVKVYNKKYENKIVPSKAIVCQRENPFYVDTVRLFRDRRYEYKAQHKQWKKKLDDALHNGIASEIDRCKKMVVLYDSLQLAHKCILNSFYGYVMRKGSRWFSMEMAGIVCLTGAKIIQMARQLVERVGRPLELDTDGIWCILPQTFPENYTFKFKGGKTLPVSYPCAMLNHLVHEKFTNHQYQDLDDAETYRYKKHSENSIFFEVDGPYKAMILPASTEEDKLLKKRYAVFNEDGSLAELKGFEVKRRGELKIIKIFQSEIFKVFLKGDTLETCYGAVAEIANRWLDILYSKGADLEDDELIELISENRSMSKSLEEYGAQKSTSISTAKRLAEFLGDQMVKDKGLNCKFIISSKPSGVPVSERSIPVAIFQAESSVKKYHLRAWLKDPALSNFDIRNIVDWNYYLERFGSVIQKLITIPAAMQKVSNPVPRVKHPDWLGKRVAEREETFKQIRITNYIPKSANALMTQPDLISPREKAVILSDEPLSVHSFGGGASMGRSYGAWLIIQKQKWRAQILEQDILRKQHGPNLQNMHGRRDGRSKGTIFGSGNIGGMTSFLRKQADSLVNHSWEVLQIAEGDTPGEFRIWALVNRNLHSLKLHVPRVFYVNSKTPNTFTQLSATSGVVIRQCVRTLPRSHKCHYLYEMQMTEQTFRDNTEAISSFTSHPNIEGVYELNVPLMYRALISLGASIGVTPSKRNKIWKSGIEGGFELGDLVPTQSNLGQYLENAAGRLNFIFLYHSSSDSRHLVGLFSTAVNRSHVFVVDRSNQLPNLSKAYSDLMTAQANIQHSSSSQLRTGNAKGQQSIFSYHNSLDFQVAICGSEGEAWKAIQRTLVQYNEERHGPSLLLVQSQRSIRYLSERIINLNDFPIVTIPSHKSDNQFTALDWQRPAARQMVAHLLNVDEYLKDKIRLAKYIDAPICNIDADFPIFSADLAFARRLQQQNMILWLSLSGQPDLGGREADENQFVAMELLNPEINNPGSYRNICVELEVNQLAVNTLLRSSFINDIEGTSSTIGLDANLHAMNGHLARATSQLDTDIDDQAVSWQHFNIIKSLVTSWTADLFQTQCQWSEMMVEHCLRWITSPSSKFYDPAMYSLIHGMMHKVFAQLVAEFRRLGAQPVFASFTKLILVTPKPAMTTAKTYVKYILKAITQHSLFDVLDINATQFWEHFLWMDYANYGGVNGFNNIGESTKAPSIIMKWNIKEYLPPAVQPQFLKIVAELLHSLHLQKVEWLNKNPLGIIPASRQKNLQTEEPSHQDNLNFDDVDEFKRRLIESVLGRQLLTMVKDIDRNISLSHAETEDDQIAASFPRLPGSYLPMNNVALEFIKSVCAVLELDTFVHAEVRRLKKSLLTLIGISDFSEKAQFMNPCETIKLSRIICGYCNLCSDLDLCRDPDLLPDAKVGSAKLQPWHCKGCGMEYNKQDIEEELVGTIGRRLLAWQLQDVTCQKCHSVRGDSLAAVCSQCGGGFATARGAVDVARRLQVLRGLADLHGFQSLQEMLASVT